jgi:hypothetical protein
LSATHFVSPPATRGIMGSPNDRDPPIKAMSAPMLEVALHRSRASPSLAVTFRQMDDLGRQSVRCGFLSLRSDVLQRSRGCLHQYPQVLKTRQAPCFCLLAISRREPMDGSAATSGASIHPACFATRSNGPWTFFVCSTRPRAWDTGKGGVSFRSDQSFGCSYWRSGRRSDVALEPENGAIGRCTP